MDNYDPLKTVGRGAFAVAKLCQRKSDGAYVVVKTANMELSHMTEKERANYKTEIRLLSRLDHPAIIRYVDNFIEDDVLSIVLEYADGGSLRKAISGADGAFFPESRIMRWFAQTVSALDYIHGKNVLHRDIKPENLLLSGPDRAVLRVADFGIAKSLGSNGAAATEVGTPYYFSPELVEGQSYEYASDIWSAGCVLFETCMLRRPFDASNWGKLALNIIEGAAAQRRLDPAAGFSPDVQRLVGGMLHVKPAERPNAAELLHDEFVAGHLRDHAASVREYEELLRQGLVKPSSPYAAPPPASAPGAGGGAGGGAGAAGAGAGGGGRDVSVSAPLGRGQPRPLSSSGSSSARSVHSAIQSAAAAAAAAGGGEGGGGGGGGDTLLTSESTATLQTSLGSATSSLRSEDAWRLVAGAGASAGNAGHTGTTGSNAGARARVPHLTDRSDRSLGSSSSHHLSSHRLKRKISKVVAERRRCWRCGEGQLAPRVLEQLLDEEDDYDLQAVRTIGSGAEMGYLVLTSRADVLCWGVGEHGQLGLGRALQATREKRKIPDFVRSDVDVQQMDASYTHAGCVSADGEVWLWGTVKGHRELARPRVRRAAVGTKKKMKKKKKKKRGGSGGGHDDDDDDDDNNDDDSDDTDPWPPPIVEDKRRGGGGGGDVGAANKQQGFARSAMTSLSSERSRMEEPVEDEEAARRRVAAAVAAANDDEDDGDDGDDGDDFDDNGDSYGGGAGGAGEGEGEGQSFLGALPPPKAPQWAMNQAELVRRMSAQSQDEGKGANPFASPRQADRNPFGNGGGGGSGSSRSSSKSGGGGGSSRSSSRSSPRTDGKNGGGFLLRPGHLRRPASKLRIAAGQRPVTQVPHRPPARDGATNRGGGGNSGERPVSAALSSASNSARSVASLSSSPPASSSALETDEPPAAAAGMDHHVDLASSLSRDEQAALSQAVAQAAMSFSQFPDSPLPETDDEGASSSCATSSGILSPATSLNKGISGQSGGQSGGGGTIRAATASLIAASEGKDESQGQDADDDDDDDEDRFVPLRVAALSEVVATKVSCGEGFTVVLDRAGRLFSFGTNDDGCLGLGDEENRVKPCWVQALMGEVVVTVSAGTQHVLACTESRQVFAWGDSTDGRLGLGETWVKGDEKAAAKKKKAASSSDGMNEVGYPQPWPKIVPELRDLSIVSISAGDNHSGAVTADGTVYMWGGNDDGQLGHGDVEQRSVPAEVIYFVENEEVLVEVECGHGYSAAINEERQLFTWGGAEGGRLGHGNAKDKLEPGLVMKLRKKGHVAHVHCGRSVMCVLTDVSGNNTARSSAFS
eukprot:g2880.t1